MKYLKIFLVLSSLLINSVSFADFISVKNSQDCIVKNINICVLAKDSANKMNADLPKTLGNITYTSVVADGRQIIHTYSVNYGLQEATKLTKFTEEEMKENQHRMVYHMVCDDKDTKLLLDYGLSIVYIYKFKDGAVNRFVVSNCQNGFKKAI